MEKRTLEEIREHYRERIQSAQTVFWRARMVAEYWSVCRHMKAQRLGVPYVSLAWEDNGDSILGFRP